MIAKKIRTRSQWMLFMLVVIVPVKLGALNLSLKVSYGFSYMAVGDTNSYLNSIYTSNTLRNPFDQLHFAGHLSGEIYFQLKPRLSIFVGTGKILLSQTNSSSRGDLIHSFVHKIEAIPLVLGLRVDLNLSRDTSRYYFIPQVIGYVKVAAGYYFTTWNMAYDFRVIGQFSRYYINKNQKADANHFGASGALGLEIRISRLLSFTIEASGLYLTVDDYQGEYKYSTSDDNYADIHLKDTLYFYEYYENNQWMIELQIGEKPGGPGVRNVRPAEVDFSGFSISLGIKINL